MTAGVLVTRPATSAAPLLGALREAGYATHAVPTVVLEPVDPWLALRPALAELGLLDWLVITSPKGADVVAAELVALPPARRPQIAVIGPGTHVRLAAHDLAATAISAEPSASALIDAMAAHGPIHERSVVLARSDAAGPVLPRALAATGARVRALVAYRTVEGPRSSRGPFLRALADPGMHLAHFASGSALRGALLLAGKSAVRLRDLRIVTIGPATSAVVRGAGITVAAEAARPDLASQVEAVERAWAGA